MSKKAKVIIGIILLIVGIALIVMGFMRISGAVSNLGSSSFGGATAGIIFIVAGFIIAAIGGILIYLANMKKLVEYSTNMATKQSEKIGEAMGRGMSKGMN